MIGMVEKRINEIYNDFIEENNKRKEKQRTYKKYGRISNTGRCFKRTLMNKLGIPEAPKSQRENRLLRLGELIHKDYQKALKRKGWTVEQKVVYKDLKVAGSCDAFEIIPTINKLIVIDFKSISYWGWKKMFGKSATDSNGLAEMQTAMYTMQLAKDLNMDINNAIGYVYYYKKDDSVTRAEIVLDEYYPLAISYWNEFNKLSKDISNNPTQLRPGQYGVPFFSWECNYCPYQKQCGGLS